MIATELKFTERYFLMHILRNRIREDVYVKYIYHMNKLFTIANTN